LELTWYAVSQTVRHCCSCYHHHHHRSASGRDRLTGEEGWRRYASGYIALHLFGTLHLWDAANLYHTVGVPSDVQCGCLCGAGIRYSVVRESDTPRSTSGLKRRPNCYVSRLL